MRTRMRWQRPTRRPRPIPKTVWPRCWNAGGPDSSGGVDRRGEPLQLDRLGLDGRRRQLQWDAVDHARHRALFPIEIQRAMLEVLHDPLRLLYLAAGWQAQRATLEA